MRSIAIAVVLTIVTPIGFAFDKSEFDTLIKQVQNNELDTVKAFLDANRQKYREDPEYYVVLLNYSLVAAEYSHMVLSTEDSDGAFIELQDPKTGEPVGFMGAQDGYDETIIHDAVEKTTEALPNFESRLDIHIGLAMMAEKIKDWPLLSELVTNMIEVSTKIDNQWIWGPLNSMDGEPKDVMLDSIEAWVYEMFYEETDEADEALTTISRKLVESYPGSVYGYANLGTYYLAKKKYEEAESYYDQALAVAPNDEIVKANLEILKKMKAAD